MLHHLSFAVSDLARSARLYDACLAPLGYVQVFANATFVGYGVNPGQDRFALAARAGARGPGAGFHLAFAAPSRAAVDAFHAAALAHGGVDNGAPGLRPDYGAAYYAAFVIDPDGYHIEAVINGR